MFFRALSFLAVLFFASAAFSQDSIFPTDVQRLIDLPDTEIDIAIAALAFAKESYPNLDVGAYSKKIDELAEKVRLMARGTQDPERRIRVLNTVIFRDGGYRYDRDPFARANQDYYFLNGILDTKKGICYTLPLLYVAVGQRVGYPVRVVVAPDHMFVRYDLPGFKQNNIEVTSGGQYFSNESYVERFLVSKRGIESGSYMRMLTNRELIAEMLGVNAGFHGGKGDGRRAVAYLEKAVSLYPTAALMRDNLRGSYFAMAKITRGDEAKAYRAKGLAQQKKTVELGFVDPGLVQKPKTEIRGQ
jgi:regulator of sirC expression with transglutaminase-like and TPR domain